VTGSSLPRKLEDLRGCLARRYVRVSSEEQGWKYGPDGQNLTIDEAIDRAGLQESGQPFLDEQSAWRNSGERPALQALLSASLHGQYKVLVVAYFSRWSRDAEVALRIRRELHAAGVALYFADEGFLSTDENAHERYLDEAIAAEKFSHRLSRTIKRTHAAKFERYGDQAGSPGLGFYRTPQPMARLAIDSDTMPRVIALYVRYARDDISYRALAREMGIAEGAIHAILTNPLYNGWAVRNRRSPDERRVAAPWRDDPPVSDELWAHVAEVRARRNKTAGRQRPKRVHMLAKRMFCTRGRGVSADTLTKPSGPNRRYRHKDCPLWPQASYKASVFEEPIAMQIGSIRLTKGVLDRISRMAKAPVQRDTTVQREELERELSRKAAAHAARRITTDTYLGEHDRINRLIDELDEQPPAPSSIDPDRAITWLEDLKRSWEWSNEAERANLVRAIYRRIVVEGDRFIGVELTEEAKANGLALALPQSMALARPARARPCGLVSRATGTSPRTPTGRRSVAAGGFPGQIRCRLRARVPLRSRRIGLEQWAGPGASVADRSQNRLHHSRTGGFD